MQEKTNTSLSYPVNTTPATGKAVQAGPGVHWLRLPIPFELNHINVWLLDDGDGYTLVDTGISSTKTRQTWQQIFKELIKNKAIKRVIVTHFHPDHFGLARWLCDEQGAEYVSSQETVERTALLLGKTNRENDDARKVFYQRHGIEDWEIFEKFLKGNLYAEIVSGNPLDNSILGQGDTIAIGGNDWQVIMSYGHAPGHICLYCKTLNMLISGDQVLPTISSNVSVYADQPNANPLRDFLDSFQAFAALPEDTIVLPSHGKVFQGLHRRIEEIIGHHDEMLERVVSICQQAHTVTELVPKLFPRKLEGVNTVLAFGETLSHLNYLHAERRLQRKLHAGRYIYSATTD